MKKVVIIFVGIFVAGLFAVQSLSLEKVLANESVVTAVEWVNNLGRKPEDPAYLTLNYRMRRMYFSLTADRKQKPVAFFGDSITFGADWQRLFPDVPVVNRGISGDTTLGLLERQEEVIALRPRQIFLMIGTNDLCFNRPIGKVIENYDRILNRFRTELPATPVFVQSILPFNDKMYPSNGLRKNKNIFELNKRLKLLARKHGYVYSRSDSGIYRTEWQFAAQYTYDGLHLNDSAYLVWRPTDR